ncbi:MAG: metallophosphoesterase family protein [Planctomycetes bacterium]|nr:metallophosphoesterase family protein [Planctomycetota bacterium]
MRILVLGDIHSNWPALAAIDERFDACLFVGDLVDYAADPVPCIDWVRSHAQAAVRGNHDHAVAQHVQVRGDSGYRRLAAATRPLHWELIDPHRMKYLARLPVTARIAIDGLTFLLVHGTPRDPLDEYLTADAKAWAERLEGVEADFVCVGHTHIAFELQLQGKRVLNPGSVGQPRDGDPRASYAVIDNGRVEFRRAAYDIDATLLQMRKCGVAEDAIELAAGVLRTGSRPEAAAPSD